MTTRSMLIPYSGNVSPATIAAAIDKLLGDSPGRGMIQLRVVEHVPPPPNAGPGTELKKLLSRIGITPKAGCKCLARAVEMDIRGCEWCEANIDTIVGWLREEAPCPSERMSGRGRVSTTWTTRTRQRVPTRCPTTMGMWS